MPFFYHTTINNTMIIVILQLISNDLELRYANISIEPYGNLSVDYGVPSRLATIGKYDCYLVYRQRVINVH